MSGMGARVKGKSGVTFYGPGYAQEREADFIGDVEWVEVVKNADLQPGDRFYHTATGPTTFLVLKPWVALKGFSGAPLADATGVMEIMQDYDITTAQWTSCPGNGAAFRRIK
jgi:hypothetical protein